MRGPITTWLIVALALLLRLWGLDFGLPMAESRPDELTIAYQAMKFGTLDLNPHSFNYPSLFKYLVFGVFGAWYAVGRLISEFSGQEELLRSFFAADTSFRLLMRLLVAGFGTLTVALITKQSRGAGLLLAVACLHVRDSHFGVTDIPMGFFATGAVLAAARVQSDGGWRMTVVAAMLAGLATSTKYNAGLLCVPLTVAALLGPGAWPDRLRRLIASGGVMVGAFVLGTPFAVLDFPTFYKDFTYELTHLSTGHRIDIGIGYVHHITESLRHGVGLPLLVGGAIGIVDAFRHSWRRALTLYAFPLVYYLVIGHGETAFFRYILPVVPFLCLGAGELADRLGPRIAVLAMMALPTAFSSIHVVRLMAAGDTREAMGAYIEAEVPTDATIVHGGTGSGAPLLQRNVANQTREYEARAGRADSAGFRKPDDLRWYQAERPRYDLWVLRKEGLELASQKEVSEVLSDPPEWLLLEEYGLVHYAAVPEAVRELARRRYVKVHSERAWSGRVSPVFDQQDAFYLPIAGFGGFRRMGPTLHLYHRKDL